jgi:hypothetical protein
MKGVGNKEPIGPQKTLFITVQFFWESRWVLGIMLRQNLWRRQSKTMNKPAQKPEKAAILRED